MDFLKNKVIWITGGGTGIGAATVKRLAKTGAKVVASSRGELSRYQADGHYEAGFFDAENLFYKPCDVTDAYQVKHTAESISKEIGSVDILINNAGAGKFAPFMELTREDIHSMMSVNFVGTFACTQAVLPTMLEKQFGIVLNVLSVAAISAFPGSTVYAATKAAAHAMSRSLRTEVRNLGIKVIDFIPGATETSIWDAAAIEELGERMMKPDDVAEAIVCVLQSNASKYTITEQIILKPQGGDL